MPAARAQKPGYKRWSKTYRPRNAMACVLTWMKDLELMKDAIAGNPNVFIGFGRIDPNDPNAIREIEILKKTGLLV